MHCEEMEQDPIKAIKEDLEFFTLKISNLSGDKNQILSVWMRLRDNIDSLNKMLETERRDWKKEREELEEERRVEREKWMAKEMCLAAQNKALKADQKLIDLMIQARMKSKNVDRAVLEIKNERLENSKINKCNTEVMSHVQVLEEANQKLVEKMMEKEQQRLDTTMKWLSQKNKVQQVIQQSDELRTKNQEQNEKYRARLAQQMEELKSEREKIHASAEEMERALPVLVIRRHRLMQELKEKHSCSSDDMSEAERKEWKKMQKKWEKEAKRLQKEEKKRLKELQKTEKKALQKSQERRSFWRRLLCCVQ